MSNELTIRRDQIVELVLDSVSSPHSKKAYESALDDFLAWYEAKGRPGLSKAVVQAYKSVLETRGLAPSSVNLKLSAIRALAREAADNGLVDGVLANGIARVKGVKNGGRKTGNWIPREEAQALKDAPDPSTLKGLRDRAILAVLLGCGLRRSELVSLTIEHVQQREGRWALVDLVGKGQKLRTVPMPSWAKVAIDAWTERAGISEGRIFRSVAKGGKVVGESISSQAIADVVGAYSELAAHDLRRTWAKLAHVGGARIEQIQLSLGHSSVTTTERYLGIEQDLTDAPCDHLGLS